MKTRSFGGTALIGMASVLLLATGGGRAAAAPGAGPAAPAEVKRAYQLCTDAYPLLMAENFDAAEPKLLEAAEALPAWATPHALLGVLYQWKAFRIGQDLLSGNADRLRRQAMEHYEVVQRSARQAVYTSFKDPYWLDGTQWLAPARGLFGGSQANLVRALETVGRPGTAPVRPKLATDNGPKPSAEAGGDNEAHNELPASNVRLSDPYYAKYGKTEESQEVYYEALTCYLVNQRRLMAAKCPMVPEPTLSVMSRLFSLWCVNIRAKDLETNKDTDTGGLQHMQLKERFWTAFPDLFPDHDHLAYPVGEVLSLCGSRYGQYVLDADSIDKAIRGFFKSPEHCECLMHPDNLFTGPALGEVHHDGSFFLTINVIRSARAKVPGNGSRAGGPDTASR